MYELLYKYFAKKTAIGRVKFEEISSFFKPINAGRNEILLSEGQTCKFFLFVNRGCIRFYSINDDGIEQTRYFAFEGKFGTALSSLITQEPSNESIQSVENSELLSISRKDLFHLVETVPEVNYVYRDILEMAYTTSQKRIYHLQGEDALSRLKWLMEYRPMILSRLSSKLVASYLGITPYTLSRLKAKL